MTPDTPMSEALPRILEFNPCVHAQVWLHAQRGTVGEAWLSCERGDWLLWLAAYCGCDRRKLVMAAAACARLALKYVPAGEDRPRIAIETAERWARGEPGVSVEDTRAAYAAIDLTDDFSYAADAAAVAAYVAVHAVDAVDAFSYAAQAATSAAYAHAHAAAAFESAKADILRACADIAREHIRLEDVLAKL